MQREFDAMERMTDRFDRAATLNFTTVAMVDGLLEPVALERAVTALCKRHPLLGAAISRQGSVLHFIPGDVPPISLHWEHGDPAVVDLRLSESLQHATWPDEGPRGRLRVVHDAGAATTTLLLTLHHDVSDGSSGVIAMRDLLCALQGQELGEPLDSPGPVSFLPPAPADQAGRIQAYFTALAAPGTAVRPRDGEAPLAQRGAVLQKLSFTRGDTATLLAFARAMGATLHGVLVAAMAKAIAVEWPEPVIERVSHPINLRRYLAQYGDDPGIGDRVGYYVSAVETVHTVGANVSLGSLAREVSDAVRRSKEQGDPLLTGPASGPGFVAATSAMTDDEFRAFSEEKVLLGTFGLSNLGSLDAYGMVAGLQGLRVRDVYFVTASSIFGAIGASASTFDGQLSLVVRAVTPLVSEARFSRIADRTRGFLMETLAEATA